MIFLIKRRLFAFSDYKERMYCKSVKENRVLTFKSKLCQQKIALHKKTYIPQIRGKEEY